MSAFLDLAKDDVVANPAPDVEGQKRILWQAMGYVNTTTSRLPNLFATRITTHYETTLPAQDVSYASQAQTLTVDPEALQRKGEYSRTVTYRNGHEVLDSGAGTRSEDDAGLGLTSSGEFGPILGTVMGDAMHGSFRWMQWEKGSDGTVAEFSYAVPKSQSHYRVGITSGGPSGWVVPIDDSNFANRADVKELYVPCLSWGHRDRSGNGRYLAVEPGSGGDVVGGAAVGDCSGIRSGHNGRAQLCLCGEKRDFSQNSSIHAERDADGCRTPVQIKLNDVVFTHYHLFNSTDAHPGDCERG